ncbi:MAG: peptidoglycan DD-metalloendopeptidase family protein [Gammaproteobacteria bacterium]|nr:peptidoglycan DD-metalloendopeptidase family protein [Gammaproteobacteria bacterium]
MRKTAFQSDIRAADLSSLTRLRARSLLGALLLVLAVPSHADRVEIQQQKLQAVRNQISTLQDALERKIGQRSTLEQQLSEIEKQLNTQHRALRNLRNNLRNGERDIKKLNNQQAKLYSELEKHQRKLIAQLRTAYFIGNQEQLKILLSQQDPSALARTLKYFEYLNRARLQSIETSRSTLREIEATQIKIEQQNRQLANLTQAQQREYQEIENSRNKRQQVLTQLKTEIQNDKSSVVTLKQDETQIRELIASLTGIFSDIPPETSGLPFVELKGLLNWPVQGKHLNLFAATKAGSDLSWQGIKIAAPGGREVHAISNGRVAFADWIPVFGLILLIDHSDGYMSLYAHNESLFKETGDWVRTGEVIANVGNSGGEQTDSLYFEIRHNGKPLDPAKWCVAHRS